MAARSPKRTEWRQKHGMWTRSLGQRGARVRLFQREKDGVFYRDVWRADGKYDRKSLGTTDRREAERIGREILAGLLCNEFVPSRVLTLGELWERYRRDAAQHLDNTDATKSNTETQVAILLGYWGADRDVATLTENDQAAFTRSRLKGGLQYVVRGEHKVTKPVRARAVEANLKVLHQMLLWATRFRVGSSRLLDRHPLEGVHLIREQNPRRPLATWERYQATRQAIQELAGRATDREVQVRWVRVELVLVLAEATGRRAGAIRKLHWEDINFDRGNIRWRKEADKKGREYIVSMPHALTDELRQFQRRLSPACGLIFPAPGDPTQPVDRRWLSRLVERAEREAKLDKLDGSVFHAYRRSWASARKGFSVADVAVAGGWADPTTVYRIYQRPDEATMLAVMGTEVKVTARGVEVPQQPVIWRNADTNADSVC